MNLNLNMKLLTLSSLLLLASACAVKNPADPNVKKTDPTQSNQKPPTAGNVDLTKTGPSTSPGNQPTTSPTDQSKTPAAGDLVVIGIWRSPVGDGRFQDANGALKSLKSESLIEISTDKVTIRQRCTSDSAVTEIEASAKAIVDAKSIDLQESLISIASPQVGKNKADTDICEINLPKQKIQYEIKNNQLFFMENGKNTLVGEEKITASRK